METILSKHGVSEAESCGRESGARGSDRFVERGFRGRDFFPHRVHALARGGPDGMLRAQKMCGVTDPDLLRELLLFAAPETRSDLPRELFFDEEVSWHGHHMGLPGLVASANLVRHGDRLFVTQLLSDLVQRISRVPGYRSRIENRFRGWAHLLINAAAHYGLEAGLREICLPTSGLAIEHTAADREVGPELFERVYDRAVQARLDVVQVGAWWSADLAANRQRVAPLSRWIEPLSREKAICICHDIGPGTRIPTPAFERTLRAHEQAAATCTFHLPGVLFPQYSERIAAAGHALAFHSYEARVLEPPRSLTARWRRWRDSARSETDRSNQYDDFFAMKTCRELDSRLRGYRPPGSILSPGLADRHLAYFNFEWLVSSTESLGRAAPRLEGGIVKIPIHIDDRALERPGVRYDAWASEVLALADSRNLLTICLSDGHALRWLPQLQDLLSRLALRGRFANLDQIADETLRASCRWH